MRTDDAIAALDASDGSPQPDGHAALDERYGRTRSRKKWNRRGALIAGIAGIAVVGAWVVWGGLDGATTAVDSQNTAYKILNDRQISMTWRVTMTPGSHGRCALQAQNSVHATVGWKIVDVPASTRRNQSFTGIVNTTDLAVTGLIYRCWLT